MTTAVAPAVAQAAARVPERHYTHNEARGETIHRTNPTFVRRDLSFLDVEAGMRVLEIGTGSGLTGGLLAELVGRTGHVVSLDIDPFLTRWANHIHDTRGLGNIRCHTVNGTDGFPEKAPFHRLGAWCTPPRLPKTWVEQVNDGGLIVATLPIAPVPNLVVGTTIRITDGRPYVERVFPGAYIETASSPRSTFAVPPRWVDWENRVPATSWISVAWRDEDDWKNSAAHATLDRLLDLGHTERYQGEAIDWSSLRLWLAATGTRLTMTELAEDVPGLGHSTRHSVAVIQEDGTILADSTDSGSLTVLRGWLAAWENAGRPGLDAYTPTLVPDMDTDVPGWDLRLSR
ncbi:MULTISPECIES: hypothetical protein [Streptomyces]|uniref:Protein-L-isoaspartate O-methyltransferase n=1 Tax=Streptomyces griseocarneus TaxID=51201 RepID=A0ABX7RS52_9ACTN|nr:MULTISPECIES: hypothetical protein [Streptomyces]QSY51107.1 protein-L-isoaspartate(D-aspartate) O-methyltransferase [Streptomyces griseocarneus]